MAQPGFAIAAYRDAGVWRAEPMPPAVLGDLGVLLQALRSQPPEGGPFVIACVDDEFFLIARQDGPRISLLLSDMTASVEYPLAEQALARLGEDPPEDDELDEVWPVGELPLVTRRAGGAVAIVNIGPTARDEDAELKIDGSAGETLESVVAALAAD